MFQKNVWLSASLYWLFAIGCFLISGWLKCSPDQKTVNKTYANKKTYKKIHHPRLMSLDPRSVPLTL